MISFRIGAEAGEDRSWHGKPDNWSRAGEQLSEFKKIALREQFADWKWEY
jgi:hypothetical protein